MRVLDVEQGSREWVEARLGIPTASAFKRIVTSTGKLSAQRDAYQAELLSEWVFGEPAKDFDNRMDGAREGAGTRRAALLQLPHGHRSADRRIHRAGGRRRHSPD